MNKRQKKKLMKKHSEAWQHRIHSHLKTGVFYGQDAINKNVILYKRRPSHKPNGLILGTLGKGQAFRTEKVNFFEGTIRSNADE